MPIEVSEALVRAIATKDKALSDGRTIAKKGAYKKPMRTADGSLIWADCQGSALYKVSVDLGGDRPVPRCSCPVKPPPCKHVLGLLVHFMEKADAFKPGEPPAELQEKRAKAQERSEKRAEAAAKPKKVNQAALAKKTAQQREALDLLETIVLDVASAGLGTLDAKRGKKLADQARQMNDAYLPGAAVGLLRLAALAAPVTRADEDDELGLEEHGSRLPEEDRQRLMVRHVTRLWATVKKGKKHLEAKLDEGESESDADAVVEEMLGHAWRLDELKAKGHSRQGLELVELAYERWDDDPKQECVEQSWLVDLADGAVHVDRSMRPYHAKDRMKEKESYDGVLAISDAALYPGFVNRRVRWELGAVKHRDPEARDWERVRAIALPSFEQALAKVKEQLRNPLAPDEVVLLVRARDVVKTPAGTALVDDAGTRLLLDDSPLARSRTTATLDHAAGALARGRPLAEPIAVLVRFWVGLQDGLVRGQPLCLVARDRIRVGV